MFYTQIAESVKIDYMLAEYRNSVTYKIKQVILSCETYAQVVVAKRMLAQQIKFGTVGYFKAKQLELMIRDKLQVVK